MSSKAMGRYNKTITVRLTEEQYKRYRNYCIAHKIALNELTRFVLDKATLGDAYVDELISQYEKRIS